MFNKDFYPTPHHVLDRMNIDCRNKVVLEPSAGKGDIIEWLYANNAKEVLSCEINPDLAEIVKTKSKFLANDFLKVVEADITHINMIVMNPPFSKGAEHLLHAWDIAPGGTEIVSLINYESVDNTWSRSRERLSQLIRDYGSKENLNSVFSDSERPTNVEIGLVHLYKPRTGENEFEGFFLDEEEVGPQSGGVMKYDAIFDAVQRYIASVKCFEEFLVVSDKMNKLVSPFNVGGFSFKVNNETNSVITKEDFKKQVQKKAWAYLFNLINIDKYVTSGVMKNVTRFVETQEKVPFTMKNIYRMFEIIIGSRQEMLDNSLVEAMDAFTKFTHENRHHVEGWKTNSGHLLNQKFIVPYMVEGTYSGRGNLSVRWSNHADKIEDLVKIICNLTGTDYKITTRLYNFLNKVDVMPGVWYSWDFFEKESKGTALSVSTPPKKIEGFFEIKAFKKGTMHFKFKDKYVWELLNRQYAKIKGCALPEKI